MKLPTKLLTTSTIILSALATTTASASQCHTSQMGFDELRYSSKKELIAEYCLTRKVVEIYEPGPNARISELRAYSDRLRACAGYVGQVRKVLKKEHGVTPDETLCKK